VKGEVKALVKHIGPSTPNGLAVLLQYGNIANTSEYGIRLFGVLFLKSISGIL
jgi:hypothetical protein